MSIDIAKFSHGARPLYGGIPISFGHLKKLDELRKIPIAGLQKKGIAWLPEQLLAITAMMKGEKPMTGSRSMQKNPEISAGFTYLGQFIAHDISFHKLYFRDNIQPTLRLMSLYGGGQDVNPGLYAGQYKDFEDDCIGSKHIETIKEFEDLRSVKFLLRRIRENRFDFVRSENEIAWIADSRNDQNLIIGQVHIAFARFHNAIAEYLYLSENIRGQELFQKTRQLVVHYFQGIVLNQYLKGIVYDPTLIDRLIQHDSSFELFKPEKRPELLPEFSLASFRMGHSQVLDSYSTAPGSESLPLFSSDPNAVDLSGFKRLDEVDFDWSVFFEFPGKTDFLQPSAALDTTIASHLYELRELMFKSESLPEADIKQSSSIFGSHILAQKLYKSIGYKDNVEDPISKYKRRPITVDNVIDVLFKDLPRKGIKRSLYNPNNFPLWLYILLESELLCNGKKLGPLGSHIIAEQMVWILKKDVDSILNKLDQYFLELIHKLSGDRIDNKGVQDSKASMDSPLNRIKTCTIQNAILFPQYIDEHGLTISSKVRQPLAPPPVVVSGLESIAEPDFPLLTLDEMTPYLGTEPMTYSMLEYTAHLQNYLDTSIRDLTISGAGNLYGNPGAVKNIHVFFSIDAVNKLIAFKPNGTSPVDPSIRGVLFTLGMSDATNPPTSNKFRLLAQASNGLTQVVGTDIYKYPGTSVESPIPILMSEYNTTRDNFKVSGYQCLHDNAPLFVDFSCKALYRLIYGANGVNAVSGTVRFDLLIRSNYSNKMLTLGGVRQAWGTEPTRHIEGEPCPPNCYGGGG